MNLIVLTGPTGSGKSALALEIARRLNGEIVNADSVQVFRGFDIGSAKPTPAEMSTVPHHLFSALDPTEEFSAGEFAARAEPIIQDIAGRGRLPIVVGGTGLYIQALLHGLVPISGSGEGRQAVRALETELLSQGVSPSAIACVLHEKLLSLDPDTALQLEPSDIARVRRALEVQFETGLSLRQAQETHRYGASRYRALVCALLPNRQQLYARIARRVEQMIRDGLVEEVRSLLQRYPASAKPFLSIGYRQVVGFIAHGDEPKMIELIKRDTRRFAKRQYTWWRHQPHKLGWKELPEAPLIPDVVCRQIECFCAGKGGFAEIGQETLFQIFSE